ncbi:Glioma pathogenesis-related protein 1, partial [Lamellibrachia satsuma]
IITSQVVTTRHTGSSSAQNHDLLYSFNVTFVSPKMPDHTAVPPFRPYLRSDHSAYQTIRRSDHSSGQTIPPTIPPVRPFRLSDYSPVRPFLRSDHSSGQTIPPVRPFLRSDHSAGQTIPPVTPYRWSDHSSEKWNSYLASMAADWADGCDFNHGQPARDANTLPYNQIGQNLYLTSANSINLDSAIQAWYNEIEFYTYDTRACSLVCGHYTQVVWAETREVGCAHSYCDPMTGTSIRRGTYLVCNYGPPGNYPRHPFTKGDPCTACPSGQAWCTDGLCRRECKVECANCGVANQTACSCTCQKGWTGDYCTRECRNYHKFCTSGWPKRWCDDAHPYVPKNCPLLCGFCEALDPSATCNEAETTSGAAEASTTIAPVSTAAAAAAAAATTTTAGAQLTTAAASTTTAPVSTAAAVATAATAAGAQLTSAAASTARTPNRQSATSAATDAATTTVVATTSAAVAPA